MLLFLFLFLSYFMRMLVNSYLWCEDTQFAAYSRKTNARKPFRATKYHHTCVWMYHVWCIYINFCLLHLKYMYPLRYHHACCIYTSILTNKLAVFLPTKQSADRDYQNPINNWETCFHTTAARRNLPRRVRIWMTQYLLLPPFLYTWRFGVEKHIAWRQAFKMEWV